jgi:hypothetical protein
MPLGLAADFFFQFAARSIIMKVAAIGVRCLPATP